MSEMDWAREIAELKRDWRARIDSAAPEDRHALVMEYRRLAREMMIRWRRS